MCHARKERELLFGTRSADYIRASGHNGCINRPNTWLHPNASLKCPIFPLHRGRRPYMALGRHAHRDEPCPLPGQSRPGPMSRLARQLLERSAIVSTKTTRLRRRLPGDNFANAFSMATA